MKCDCSEFDTPARVRDPKRNVRLVIGGIFRQKRIRDLKPGESGYCVPWALNPDTLVLDTNHTVYALPGGTVQMYVTALPCGKFDVSPHGYRY